MNKFIFSLSLCSVIALSSASAAPIIDEVCEGLGVTPAVLGAEMKAGANFDLDGGFKASMSIGKNDPQKFVEALKEKRVGVPHYVESDAYKALVFRAWDAQGNILSNDGNIVVRQGDAVDPAKAALFYIQDKEGVVTDRDAELFFMAPRFVLTGTPLARTKAVFEGVKNAEEAFQAFLQKRVLLTHIENELTQDKATKKANGGTFAIEGRIADSPKLLKLTGRFRIEFKYAEPLTGAALKGAFDNLERDFIKSPAGNLKIQKVINFVEDAEHSIESFNLLFSGFLKDSNLHHVKVSILKSASEVRALTKEESLLLGTASRNTMLVAMRNNTPQLDKLLLEKPEGWDKTIQKNIQASLEKAGCTRQAIDVAFEWLDKTPMHAVKTGILSEIRSTRPLTREEEAKLGQASKAYMTARVKRLVPDLDALESGKKAGWEKTAMTSMKNCLRAAGYTPQAVKILFESWLGKTSYELMKKTVLDEAQTLRALTQEEENILKTASALLAQPKAKAVAQKK